jgi:hypothetical protein
MPKLYNIYPTRAFCQISEISKVQYANNFLSKLFDNLQQGVNLSILNKL